MNSSKGAALSAMLVVFALAGCEQVVQPVEASEEAEATFNAATATEIQKSSYLLGFNQGQGLKVQTLDTVDMEAVLAGLTDFVAGIDSKVDMAQAQGMTDLVQHDTGEKQRIAIEPVQRIQKDITGDGRSPG